MKLSERRQFMKACLAAAVYPESDQAKGVPQPSDEKPAGVPEGEWVVLPAPEGAPLVKSEVVACLAERVSRRKFAEQPVSLVQLSFLLWASQGLKPLVSESVARRKRLVPSAGGRHPFETYLVVNAVAGLDPGIYRYVASAHALAFLGAPENLSERLTAATMKQRFCGEAPVTLVWAATPYRTEWRYTDRAAKFILLDAGHVCQNLYLACEALGLGTCAIAAYAQDLLDELLGLDGTDEFAVYLAPVGGAV